MKLNQVISGSFQTALDICGSTGNIFFNTRDRFRSSFLIVANIAQEIISRNPTSYSNLKTLERNCSSLNLFYGLEFLTMPLSFFSKNTDILDQQAIKTNKTFFEKILETGLNISELTVVTGSFLSQLNDWDLVNLSKWSSSIGKLPALKFVNQIKLDHVIVVGCFSIMVLDVVNNLKKLHHALTNETAKSNEPLKGNYKADLCSLAQAGLGSLYFGGLVLSLKYKKFDQPSLIRAAAVTRHFLSGIVLDYIKSN